MQYTTEKMIASAEFGSYIHKAVVRLGTKTQVAELAGVETKVIEMITKGQSDHVSRSNLEAVLRVCTRKLALGEAGLLQGFINKIHPPEPAVVQEVNERIQSPLTNASRGMSLGRKEITMF